MPEQAIVNAYCDVCWLIVNGCIMVNKVLAPLLKNTLMSYKKIIYLRTAYPSSGYLRSLPWILLSCHRGVSIGNPHIPRAGQSSFVVIIWEFTDMHDRGGVYIILVISKIYYYFKHLLVEERTRIIESHKSKYVCSSQYHGLKKNSFISTNAYFGYVRGLLTRTTNHA